MHTKAASTLAALYAARINALYGADPSIIPSRRRDDFAVELRWSLMLALHDSGLSITAIAAALGRHHTTVSYALQSARSRPEIVSCAERVRKSVLPPAGCGRLLGVGWSDGRALDYYLSWLLGRRPFTGEALAGLRLIATDTALRARLAAACEEYAVGTKLGRAEIHARQAGIHWQSAPLPCG